MPTGFLARELDTWSGTRVDPAASRLLPSEPVTVAGDDFGGATSELADTVARLLQASDRYPAGVAPEAEVPVPVVRGRTGALSRALWSALRAHLPGSGHAPPVGAGPSAEADPGPSGPLEEELVRALELLTRLAGEPALRCSLRTEDQPDDLSGPLGGPTPAGRTPPCRPAGARWPHRTSRGR